jgi:hypothetical protein
MEAGTPSRSCYGTEKENSEAKRERRNLRDWTVNFFFSTIKLEQPAGKICGLILL